MLLASRGKSYRGAGQLQRIQVTDNDANQTTATRILADTIQHLPFGPVKALSYGNGLTLRP
ncbi:hypothetical protein [Methylomonas fluvii]|uniref:Uncharacterized protein n=1 Tax=Methylomonas fluvii TaxID=1854564 RepID=A0ABR9D994_9GAMM|nr:hypothetical protein [Methylomonas fluvii]MBD9359688.1 hypothetical protein [Methylomonas fluvii]CAD6872439.1 hypothetical protein [Methylomonas fluvii]